MKTFHTLPALALLSLLTACGGGGGGGQQPDVGSTPTNQNAAPANTPSSTQNTTTPPTNVSKPSNVYIAPKINDGSEDENIHTVNWLNGRRISQESMHDLSKLFPLGYSANQVIIEETYLDNDTVQHQGYRQQKEKINQKAHHLPYSLIVGGVTIELHQDGKKTDLNQLPHAYTQFEFHSTFGDFTKPEIVNKMSGSFDYKGVAFNGSGQGVLSYHVDFGSKTGNGKITGLKDHGDITLHKANITNNISSRDLGAVEIKSIPGIEGKVNGLNLGDNPRYRLGFFGPKAEEIAGYVETDIKLPASNSTDISRPIGFSGSRQ